MGIKPNGKLALVKELLYAAKVQNGEVQRGELIKNDTEKFDAHGNLIEWSSNYITYNEGFKFLYNYDGNFRCIEDLQYDAKGKLTEKTTYEYKNNGEIVIRTLFILGDFINKTTTTHDYNGNIIEETKQFMDGFVSKNTYSYDSNGNKVEQKLFKDDHLDQGYLYKYDKHGNKIEEHYFTPEGDWTDTKWIYNENGKLIEYACFSESGCFQNRNTYEYNEKGNLIKQCHFNDNDNNILHCITLYKYDDFGNTIEESEYNPKGDLNIKTTFNFDVNNNLIEEIVYDPDDDSTTIKASYKYNNFGELIEEFQNDLENGYSKTIKFEDYDEQGNWLKRISIDVNKEIHYVERQIEYY